MYSKELRNINCLILFIAYKVKISFKLKSQALNLAGMRRGLYRFIHLSCTKVQKSVTQLISSGFLRFSAHFIFNKALDSYVLVSLDILNSLIMIVVCATSQWSNFSIVLPLLQASRIILHIR